MYGMIPKAKMVKRERAPPENNVVVIEGAGSPAEINLHASDLAHPLRNGIVGRFRFQKVTKHK